jgi:hypothetical protein
MAVSGSLQTLQIVGGALGMGRFVLPSGSRLTDR